MRLLIVILFILAMGCRPKADNTEPNNHKYESVTKPISNADSLIKARFEESVEELPRSKQMQSGGDLIFNASI